MTISSVVLTDTPLLYWKLDDPTGPAASDSSGNARPGAFLGNVTLGQPGPESGTSSVFVGSGGGLKTVGNTPKAAVAYSMDCWIALTGSQPSGANIMANGNTQTDGLGLAFGAAGTGGTKIHLEKPPGAAGGDVGLVGWGAWHHLAFTIDGANNFNEYVDGVNVGAAPALAFTAAGAGDPMVVGSFIGRESVQYYLAHVAFYGVALTAARVLAHFNAPAALQVPSPAGGSTPTTVQQQLDLLNAILAAVRKQF